MRRVLIANRGEIAVRILRACRELGLETVAIFSEADRQALHVRLADRAVCVGPAPSARSYLNIPNILSAALLTGCDAIHPGYGYLAERADFAEICESHGLIFIGPAPAAIEQMGNKAAARQRAREAGVPVLPGSEGVLRSAEEALAVARQVGFPVVLKAAAGGGGKGMRRVDRPAELARSFAAASAEAEAAFGDGSLYLEKLLVEPRHVEIQVLGDAEGNVIHLGERECSIQRRHQKILEEAPSPAVTPELREQMGEAAVRLARAVGYRSAGTVEFLLDHATGAFYFLEMNTRIQVEHPVTEWITGIDLVKEQIEIAAGARLAVEQGDVVTSGHAIECRINAEDPDRNFLPQPGRLLTYVPPGGPGVRVDAAAYAGMEITPFYDSLIAKVSTWGRERDEAIARMRAALSEFLIEGVKTNLALHKRILADEAFLAGETCTDFLTRRARMLFLAS